MVPHAGRALLLAALAGIAAAPQAADDKSPGIRSWKPGPPVPRRSCSSAPVVSAGPWLVCVDGTNDDCHAARQLPDGTLSPWQTLKDWGFGGVHHGNGNVLLGDIAFNVGISGYTRRLQAKGDGVSKWEFPVPGDKIDPKNGRPREMVWGGAAAATIGARTFLYYLGGFEYRGGSGKDPASLDAVYVAERQGASGLGEWRATTPLPYPAMSPCGAGWNGRVYVLGGRGRFQVPDRWHDEVLVARPNADGTIPKWEVAGRLPRPLEGVLGFAHGGYLYALGGSSGKSHAECFRAKIQPDGRIAGWQPQAPLPKPVGFSHACVIGRHVYVVGEVEENRQAPVFIAPL